MSQNPNDFLSVWVKKHIQNESFVVPSETESRPARYAALCLQEAEEQGLTLEQLRKAASDLEGAPNLQSFMTISIDTAAQKRLASMAA